METAPTVIYVLAVFLVVMIVSAILHDLFVGFLDKREWERQDPGQGPPYRW